jgi:endonuclease/exonuclease/phosphatase family metal-dependent hydrolase
MEANAVEIMAWNVEDGFSKRERIPGILAAIDARNPDVVTFSEAYQAAEGIHDSALNGLESRGYTITRALYNDDDSRADVHGIMAIAKPEFMAITKPEVEADNPSVIRLAGRAALRLSLKIPGGASDDQFDWYGVHLFDRYKTWPDESRRRMQLHDLYKQLDPARPIGIAGDFNALDSSLRARAIHLSGAVAQYVPSAEPGRADYTGIRKIGSLSRRLASMATGSVLRDLKGEGFVNADPAKRPTMPSSRPIADLDHIMIRGLEAHNFMVHPHVVDNGAQISDHRAISASIRLRSIA